MTVVAGCGAGAAAGGCATTTVGAGAGVATTGSGSFTTSLVVLHVQPGKTNVATIMRALNEVDRMQSLLGFEERP
jgi:hypothetical protein